jgi:monosaccharide-transporting ATPase
MMTGKRSMNKRAGDTAPESSSDINAYPTKPLAECSLAVQQMIAIARAVDMQCKVLILDEPTSSLDDDEVSKLFTLMREAEERGGGNYFRHAFP